MKKLVGLTLAILISFAFLPRFTFRVESSQDHTLRQKVLVHFPSPKAGKKPPAGPVCSVTGSDQITDYLTTGWRMPAEGLTYKINPSTAPRNIRNKVTYALDAAFATWATADANQKFIKGGQTTARTAVYDGENIIAWRGLESGAIAMTYVWYWGDTGLIAEIDTIFNQNYSWAVSAYTQDCIDSNAYDVQNIATHEFGHWVGLNDLYADLDSALTMYGYGTIGELQKDTLGVGDSLGTLAIAP